jgi:hypothetical protein
LILENLNTPPSIHAGSAEVPLLVVVVMEPLIALSVGLVRFFEYAVCREPTGINNEDNNTIASIGKSVKNRLFINNRVRPSYISNAHFVALLRQQLTTIGLWNS